MPSIVKQTEESLNSANTSKGQSLGITVAGTWNITASNPVLDSQRRCVDAANDTQDSECDIGKDLTPSSGAGTKVKEGLYWEIKELGLIIGEKDGKVRKSLPGRRRSMEHKRSFRPARQICQDRRLQPNQ